MPKLLPALEPKRRDRAYRALAVGKELVKQHVRDQDDKRFWYELKSLHDDVESTHGTLAWLAWQERYDRYVMRGEMITIPGEEKAA